MASSSIYDPKFWIDTFSKNVSYYQVSSECINASELNESDFPESNFENVITTPIIGLTYGDEAKGKALKFLLELFQHKTLVDFLNHINKVYNVPLDRGKMLARSLINTTNYEQFVARTPICMRTNGGPNAGHTIYIYIPATGEIKKIATHLVPSGVVYPNVINIIDAGCLVNYERLNKEMDTLRLNGFDPVVYVAATAPVILQEHVNEDILRESDLKEGKTKAGESSANGSTKSGIAPAAEAYYGRRNKCVGDFKSLFASIKGIYVVPDVYEFLKNLEYMSPNGLFIAGEGAQGYGLDPKSGVRPFVTSTHCNVSSFYNSGPSPQSANNIIGIFKAYDTYVGARTEFQTVVPDAYLATLKQYQIDGGEFGTTTGRGRFANFLNIEMLIQAINWNGVTIAICNKGDVVKNVREDLRVFILIERNYRTGKNVFVKYQSYTAMMDHMLMRLKRECPTLREVIFSERPDCL